MSGRIVRFFQGAGDLPDATRVKHKEDILPNGSTSSIDIVASAESFRFISYLCFWGMCFFAIAVTKNVTVHRLAEGPEIEGDMCAPFDQQYPGKGLGFDFNTENHLIQTFGFTNICAFWDYSPSRELTAMVYPAFEYTLIIHLVLDFFTMWISYKRGYISWGFWTLVRLCFPIEIVLCAWFRMIFVVEATSNLGGHTAGFLGLQIVLMMVTIQNTIYIIDGGFSYSFLGGRKRTVIYAFTYCICNFVISAMKIACTVYVVVHEEPMPFTLNPSIVPGWVNGKLIDSIWMLLNALAPLVISFVRSKTEKPIIIKIGMNTPTFVRGESGSLEEIDRLTDNSFT